MISSSKEVASVLEGYVGQVWLPDKISISKAGVLVGRSIPDGVESLLVQQVLSSNGKTRGLLVLFSERARSLSDKERGWVAAIAKKVGAFIDS